MRRPARKEHRWDVEIAAVRRRSAAWSPRRSTKPAKRGSATTRRPPRRPPRRSDASRRQRLFRARLSTTTNNAKTQHASLPLPPTFRDNHVAHAPRDEPESQASTLAPAKYPVTSAKRFVARFTHPHFLTNRKPVGQIWPRSCW